MSKHAQVVEFLYRLSNYCEESSCLYGVFKSHYEELVKELLGIPKSVVLAKKFNLKDKNADDFIPSVIDEDSSFPLELLLKEQLERTFGEDLSMVRIHTGEYSHEMASNYGAKAVTVGNDIYFARGMYNPYSEEGLALLAHEIQHVVQYNDKDTFFLYDEDIAMAEYMAESIESQVKNMNLHNVNSPLVGGKYDVEGSPNENVVNEDRIDIGNTSDLDDFSSANTEIRYNITLRNGKTYNISKKEREQLVGMVTEKVKKYISEQYEMLSDDERDKFLLKVMKYVS